ASGPVGWPFDGEPNIGHPLRAQRTFGIGGMGYRRLAEGIGQQLVALRGDGRKKVRTRLIVAVWCRWTYPNRIGQAAERHRGDAFGGDQGERRLDQRARQVVMMIAATGRAFPHRDEGTLLVAVM
ncbi:MAG: hypothetical protein MUE41_13705, partial [Gemmatimonadaceae bacterium]|nr:hypothetical protein [Gemmatimonadaceae bacterium]